MGSKNRGQRRQRSRETEERRRAKEKLTEKVRVDKEESLHQDETMVVKMWKRSSLGWRTVERARLERGRRGRRTTRGRGRGSQRQRKEVVTTRKLPWRSTSTMRRGVRTKVMGNDEEEERRGFEDVERTTRVG